MSFNFGISTNAIFGEGKLNELHMQINAAMGAVQGKKALVVISNGKSTRTNGSLERLENELKQAGVEYVIFDKVGSNPTKPVVEEGGRFAKENGCDFVVTMPVLAVIDPELMMSVPAKFKAYQGFDALFHSTEGFIMALENLQEACGVADLRMSDYGIKTEEFAAMVRNAHETLGVNFRGDPCDLSDEDCMEIYKESYH